jgi:SAM-dependent methyltransferase
MLARVPAAASAGSGTSSAVPYGAMTSETEPAPQRDPEPVSQPPEQTSATSIERGRPSYSWRYGQDRRLEMVRHYVALENARILDVGCGIGTYVRRFRRYSDDVHGIEVEPERVAEASQELSNIVLAKGEALPYPDDHFDVVFSNEVIEHVDDDIATAAEMVRVTRPGGTIVVFAPNRLYPFETHGAYIGGRYVFGNIPLINWLPDPLRDRFAPHVRAYTRRGLRRLFASQPVLLVQHRVIYPGFDNISARRPLLGKFLRRALYVAETTPLHAFGLSHFLVLRKRASSFTTDEGER